MGYTTLGLLKVTHCSDAPFLSLEHRLFEELPQMIIPYPKVDATNPWYAVNTVSGLACFATCTLSHTITLLEVPRWPDPNKDAELLCKYTRQRNDPALHSVKWYRGTHEIFRYTPQEYESTQTFNESVTNSSCNLEECRIMVRLERGTARYTCEVSSEGPRFAVDRRAANMTLAVLPEYDPLITGLPTLVQAGEQALINCTSDYSLPAATIDWFVDSEPQEDPLITKPTHISGPDSEGLRASWRTLRVYPDDYETHRGYLALRCRATVPTRPPSVRSMSVRLYVATRPHISTYMFSKNSKYPHEWIPRSLALDHRTGASRYGIASVWEALRALGAHVCGIGVAGAQQRAWSSGNQFGDSYGHLLPPTANRAQQWFGNGYCHLLLDTEVFSNREAAAGCARHKLRSEMIVWTLLLLARRRVPLLRD